MNHKPLTVREVDFQVLSPLPLDRREDAKTIFQLWEEIIPETIPDRFGLNEPLRAKFSLAALDQALSVWEYAYFMKRVAKPKLQASVFMQYGPHRNHSDWSISMRDIVNFDQPRFLNLLRRATESFDADFGLVHSVVDADVKPGLQTNSVAYLNKAGTRISLCVTTHMLRKYIPEIYWTMVFGPPYVRLFTRERLLLTPSYRIEELPNGAILVQVTPNLRDLKTDPVGFEQARQAIKQHLNCDAIYDSAKGVHHAYTVPEFIWKPLS